MKLKVLLLKDVAKLGGKWQLIEVADTVFRNVLKPKGDAKLADKKTIRQWENDQKKKQEQTKLIDEKKHSAIEEMKDSWLELKVSANGDHLYEKIDKKHIINWIFEQYKAKFFDKEVDFPIKKITSLWEYDFSLKIDWKKVILKLKVLTK